jgi:transcriptional regulator with XRE-family HTH domain
MNPGMKPDMANPVLLDKTIPSKKGRLRQLRMDPEMVTRSTNVNTNDQPIDIGRNLRTLRTEQGLSIRALADLSGLNANTLSLIENNKTSPSVSTLQQLAGALNLPVVAFFETNAPKNNVSYQQAGQRLQALFAHGALADLSAGLTFQAGQIFLVTLEPGADSGATPIVHTGHEFVYCLEGSLEYTIEGQQYTLNLGDSLLFEARLPHRWLNLSSTLKALFLMILCPADERDHPTEQHFRPG